MAGARCTFQAARYNEFRSEARVISVGEENQKKQ